jgi:phosphoglucosamine mutase
VKVGRRIDLKASPTVQEALERAEARLGNRGRVVLRPSGTEPVVRVMVEGEDLAEVDRLAQELAEIVRLAAV